MTGLFSTAESSTAFFPANAVVIAWTPAVIVIAAVALAAYAGASPTLDASIDINPVAADVYAGGFIDWGAPVINSVPVAVASAGVSVESVVIAWTFDHSAIEPSAGAMAGPFTDKILYTQSPTAAFSTAGGIRSNGIFRDVHRLFMLPTSRVDAGASPIISVSMEIVPNSHGPVARTRRIVSQIILS